MITLEKMNKAFELWVRITGQSMDVRYFNSQHHDYSVYSANQKLEDSFKLDPTLKLPLLLLDYYVNQWFKDRICSLEELVYKREEVLAEVNECQNMLNLLKDEELEQVRADLLNVFRNIQIEYQIPEDSLKIFDDRHILSFLYRDSIWSLEHLHLHKFSLPEGTGNPDNAPKLVKSIHEFENPSVLIDFISRSVNCIVVGYFPNPNFGVEYSSFAFAFRRGKEVLFLTDMTKWEHPLQESMTRRAHPDRHLDEKEGNSHFPYYTLTDIPQPEENNEVKDLIIPGSENKGFPKILAYINQLDPFEAYWLTFVAGLIHDKFYTKNFIVEEESTTGFELAKMPLQLPSSTGTPTDPQEAVHAAVKAGLCGSHPHGQFEWMEKRYGNQVQKDLLFLTKYSSDGLLAPTEVTTLNLLTDGDNKSIVPTIGNKLGLKAFNMGRIGTVKELNADKAFLARYNESKMIEKAACDEFDRTHEAIYEWYTSHVMANLKNLFTNVANLSMVVEKGVILCRSEDNSLEKPKHTGNIMDVYDEPTEKAGCWRKGAGCYQFSFGLREDHKKGPLYLFQKKEGSYDRHCYLTGVRDPQITVAFNVENAYAIAAMAGVTFDELPEVLKHQRLYEKYVGNSILDRIDPMEWCIQDPWMKGLNFDVRIWISRSAFNFLRKDRGLPPHKFWLEPKKKDEMTVVKDEGFTRAMLE